MRFSLDSVQVQVQFSSVQFSSGSVQVPVGWWKLGLVLIKLISGPTSRVSVRRHLGGEHGR